MWIIVLPETHSSSKVKQGWKEDFQDEVFFFSRKIKFLGCSNSLLWQCHIQKKFGDNIFSRGSGLLSSITAKFYWFILFCTLLATFSCVRCSFEQNTRKLIVYLRNLSANNNFLFLFFISGDIFLGTHNVWTLPFSVWIQPCLELKKLCAIKKQQKYQECHILILDVSINDSAYILLNLCNSNTEKEHIEVLNDLRYLLEKLYGALM